MCRAHLVSLFIWALLNTFSLASPLRNDPHTILGGSQPSRSARLKRVNYSTGPEHPALSTYSTVVRPTNQNNQLVIEVYFNNIPRYLLLDTGSADTWMISPGFQCLNASLSSVPFSDCAFGDPYAGPRISQIGNETYYQEYGTTEVLSGIFGYSDVSIGGLMVKNQKIAIVDRGYGLGDHVRSGVVGLAPRAVTRLFENTNATTSSPNGNVTQYSPVFESMYTNGDDRIPPFFSLALQRGDEGGYVAFGSLPPVTYNHDFTFSPFRGINYYGRQDPGRYYPVQPEGFVLNGVEEVSKYRAIVDSGTAANRLPREIADRVNAAFNPPATYYPEIGLYATSCNATAPSFSININDKSFAIDPRDMFLAISYNNLCATSMTRGFNVAEGAYPDGFYVLGGPFLNNVVAVFDVHEGGMWFAVHSY